MGEAGHVCPIRLVNDSRYAGAPLPSGSTQPALWVSPCTMTDKPKSSSTSSARMLITSSWLMNTAWTVVPSLTASCDLFRTEDQLTAGFHVAEIHSVILDTQLKKLPDLWLGPLPVDPFCRKENDRVILFEIFGISKTMDGMRHSSRLLPLKERPA